VVFGADERAIRALMDAIGVSEIAAATADRAIQAPCEVKTRRHRQTRSRRTIPNEILRTP